MFRSFFTTIFRVSSAVLCAITIPPADLRSLSLYYYAVCGRMCMSSVCVWCFCLFDKKFVLFVILVCYTVCKYKTPTCFGLFSRPSSGCPPLCFVPLLFLPLICVRWVCIITQYVAACVCHLFVFGVLVCWRSARTQRKQISGRNSKGTKHSGGPPEDGSEKRPKHVGVLYLQTRF